MSGRQGAAARARRAVDEQAAARRLSRLLRAGRVECVAALAAGISHELNNVLAAVLLTADVLAPHARTPAAERALAALDQLAREGLAIAHQVLFLARAVDGQPGPFDLRHLLAEVRTLARVIVPPPATVLTSYPGDLRQVTGDAVLVYQLLLGACREARRVHRRLATLTIRACNAEPADSRPGTAAPGPARPCVLVSVIAEDEAGGKPRRPRRRAGASGGAWPRGALRQALERGGARFGGGGGGGMEHGAAVLLVHLPAALAAGS